MPPQNTAANPGDLIPAVGYIRVSWLHEQQISPEIQRSSIADWARRNGRHIIMWIEDLDVSGRTFHRRIMEGIHAIEAGQAKEIIVWKYSRYGRTRTGNAINLGRINRAGGELQSATEDVDVSTAMGKLNRGMLMEWAAFESDRAGEQWAETHANRYSRGLPAHGRARFGYIRRGRVPDPLQPHRTIRAPEDGIERYEIDPQAGPILAEIYRRYTSGESARALAAWLNHAGVLTPSGTAWSVTTILNMLDGGFGAGLIRTHHPDCGCRRAARCLTVAHIPGAQPVVITPEEWAAYRRRRERSAKMPPRARVSVYPLSGRLRCGHCGAYMTIGMDKGVPGVRYLCNAYMRKGLCAARTVRRARVEAAVLAGLTAWADDIAAEPRAHPAPPVTIQVDVDAVEAEIQQLDAALARLTRQMILSPDLIPEDAYRRTRDELLGDRAKREARLEELAKPATRTRRDFLPVIRGLVDEWPTLPAAIRREMTAELIEVVRVFRSDPKTAWVEIVSAWGETQQVSI